MRKPYPDPPGFNKAVGVVKTNPSALNGKYMVDSGGDACAIP